MANTKAPIRIRLASVTGLVACAYLLQSENAIVLIDTGFEHTTDQLKAELTKVGCSIHDITHVFYTHTHYDHIGGGIELWDQWSPQQFAAKSVTEISDYRVFESKRMPPKNWLTSIVADPRKIASVLESDRQKEARQNPFFQKTSKTADLRGINGVDFNESIKIGAFELKCIKATGHDPHHVAWFEPKNGWLFSGDVVLSVPTPFIHHMKDDPIEWLKTLNRWEKLPITRLFPGHGMPSSLAIPTIQRSRIMFKRLYLAVIKALSSSETVDISDILLKLLPFDRSLFAARSIVLLGSLETILLLLKAKGLVVVSDQSWRKVKKLPLFEELLESNNFSFGKKHYEYPPNDFV